MLRYPAFAISFLLAGSLTCAVHADELSDNAELRSQLRELKALAQELATRIEALEADLGDRTTDPILRTNDMVIVDFANDKPAEPKHGPGHGRLMPAMPATVAEVLPNCDCVLSGHRTYTVNDVRHSETLSGVAQRNAFDNCRRVSASAIRDLRIQTVQTAVPRTESAGASR